MHFQIYMLIDIGCVNISIKSLWKKQQQQYNKKTKKYNKENNITLKFT